MKQKPTSIHKKLILSLIVVAALASIAGGFALYIEIARISTAARETIQRPTFTFDASKAPDWWSGGNYYPKDDTEGYTGDVNSLPNASMTIAQGSKEAPGTCFVNYFYYQGFVDPIAAVGEKQRSPIANDKSILLKELDPFTLTINTFEGVKAYTLYQSTLEGSPSNNITRGQEFAYIQLSKGYIELQGYCETGDQISRTLPAIAAVEIKI